MGVVSAQREVPRFDGMGTVQKSPPRSTKSGCADELHLKEPGRFYGDVTAVYAGFCDVIYVRLVKITSPRNLRVIYGVNRNLVLFSFKYFCSSQDLKINKKSQHKISPDGPKIEVLKMVI